MEFHKVPNPIQPNPDVYFQKQPDKTADWACFLVLQVTHDKTSYFVQLVKWSKRLQKDRNLFPTRKGHGFPFSVTREGIKNTYKIVYILEKGQKEVKPGC